MVSENIRRYAAEGVGTALLVATVVGSGIMGDTLSGGNIAIALLANTVATGAILVVLITILGPVSGAHFNPVVTLAFAARGEFAKRDIIPFIAAQIIGGVLGTLAAHAMFDLPVWQLGIKARTGPAQWFSEIIATFTLLFVIFGGVRHKPEAIPVTVGLTITAAYWFTASTSFANPAVTIARSFTTSFAGIAPGDVVPFILAQGVGAAIAVGIAAVIFTAARSAGDR